MICLQIISNAGEARSQSMAALKKAREGLTAEAGKDLTEARKRMKEAHKTHSQLITMDAGGELDKISLILVHSEDIMMGSEITLALAEEMVEMYERFKKPA